MGLPAEAGLIWAVTLLTNLYGGIGALVVLVPAESLTVAQLSIMASVMLFAHAIPTEQAVVRRAGASFVATSALRVGMALIYGFLSAWLLSGLNLLQEPIPHSWPIEAGPSLDWIGWFVTVGQTVLLMLIAITVLNMVVDGLKWLGIVAWMSRQLTPFMRMTGQNPDLAPITTTGMLLGLAYGGGLIIQQTQETRLSRRDLFMSLSCLSLMHAIIEDTLMMLALGANVWVILVGRALISIAALWALAQFIDRTEWFVPRETVTIPTDPDKSQ
ncbi:hypothetical protein [uncultured Ruegeria sp.]|uniref:hypothetical protein n=1 Tax=uncultured Ruegeria sp. TaxID=259304 RepID=UPI002610DBCC|nr:hypothetical protein [uncultured Ruegeria sp.]